MVESQILAAVTGCAGIVTLDRPRALNALTAAMIEAIDAALGRFERDPALRVVVLRSSTERAFCAGGDMRRIRELCLAGELAEAERFFATEFALNRRLAEFDRPLVALVDGICMGGGLGLSVHGRFRVATEQAVFAMPETALGYFPDVGGSHFLPRLPAALGRWLGLTGARLDGPEAVALGLATHLVPQARLDALLEALARIEPAETVATVLDRHAVPASAPRLAAIAADCAATFGVAGDRSALQAALQRQDGAFAREALAALAQASPHSLDVALELFAAGQWSPLAECLERELAAARATLRHPDFVEGVRAVLVDKTRAPHWQPAAPA
ncbi:MAG: enoyl-CoA hydratase/isomerase family protein [Gammaproteobacteria bacterium]|nr:enoyl-CoA hydratase/isomerase family protein [Gammaproteobacteria bacterium]